MRKYAVNIGDLTRDSILAQFLFSPLIKDKTIVDAEKTIDGKAVIVNCDEKQWEGIEFTVRKKYSRNLFRLYESSNGTRWMRI